MTRDRESVGESGREWVEILDKHGGVMLSFWYTKKK